MAKKKSKRVDARRAKEGELAAKRQRFYDSGAPVSILLLMVYVIFLSIILSVGNNTSARESDTSWPSLRSVLTIGIILFTVSIAMGLYVYSYARRIVKNHLRGSVLLATLLIMLAAIRMSVIYGLSPYWVVVPVVLTGITMTIAYSQRFALGISGYLILVGAVAIADATGTLREGLGVLLACGCGVGIAILSLKKIRTRTKLIEVCAGAGGSVFLIILVAGLWQGKPWREILPDGLRGAGGMLAVGFIIQGLLPLIERIFRTATDMTLLDYGEATTPLLKRLAVEAPGTFNHSWQIGMLSEAAAEAIGANGLLCRVGSYYHDVGKLIKPRYFVENQAENFNQHKELSPTMSRMIIVGHVKDGLELLREYKIPRVLHQFSATHHGTTLVEYFYREATRQESDSDQLVRETEFRYPGPKPASKESAITMLADAVESASRTLKEPTPSRIEALVHSIAMKRLQDGQFNECDLTMRELELIEQSLVKSLCGMYHARIAYPKVEKQMKRNGEKAKVN